MSSRRKRKRERYLAATGQDKRGDRSEMKQSPHVFNEIARGIGGYHARGDLRLIARAIRGDWPLCAEKRAALKRHIMEVIRSKAPARLCLAAARAFLEADLGNVRALHDILSQAEKSE